MINFGNLRFLKIDEFQGRDEMMIAREEIFIQKKLII